MYIINRPSLGITEKYGIIKNSIPLEYSLNFERSDVEREADVNVNISL